MFVGPHASWCLRFRADSASARANPSCNRNHRQRQRRPITLAAVFAPWYGYDPLTGDCQGGLGSYHWNNDPNMAGVVDTPERGYYCSADHSPLAFGLATQGLSSLQHLSGWMLHRFWLARYAVGQCSRIN